MRLTISLGQMNVVLGKMEQNLESVRAMTAEAARRGSDIIVFPELWSTGYDLERAAEHATPLDQGIFAETARLARQHGIQILGSCLSLLGEGRYGNTAVFLDRDGQPLGHYSKIHLFRLMDEEQYLFPGDRLSLVKCHWGKAGLSICYDLRFPEMFRTYANNGAEVLFVPSEWPHPRLSHWSTLLRARAIENQLFVVGCNRVGTSGKTTFFGHSAIVDPWGEVVVEGGEDESLLTAEIDLQKVESVRSAIPIFDDRRPDIYGLSGALGNDGAEG